MSVEDDNVQRRVNALSIFKSQSMSPSIATCAASKGSPEQCQIIHRTRIGKADRTETTPSTCRVNKPGVMENNRTHSNNPQTRC
jgi:hypothetical protein